jgi:flagellar biosynthetic protein FliO
LPQGDTTVGEPLPLDLSAGVTAGGAVAVTTATLLDSGLTVSGQQSQLNADPTVENVAEQPSDAVAPAPIQSEPPLWTPNSDRFLLKNRQADLSLTTDVDSADLGDDLSNSRFSAPPVEPVVKPKPKPAKKPAAPSVQADKQGIASEIPATVETTEAASATESIPSIMDSLDMPVPAVDGQTGEPEVLAPVLPSERFSDSSATPESESILLSERLGTAAEEAGPAPVGVIRTSGGQQDTVESQPTLGQILEGSAEADTLGSQVPSVSPWRSAAVVLMCLGLVFVAVAAAKKGIKAPFSLGKEKSVKVIETISLGPGRQITIVEMGDHALILGMTPQNINLLDKVPLSAMDSDYQRTVNAIIAKESRAPRREWEERPSFDLAGARATPSLAPPLKPQDAYGASGKRISVSELRRVRAERTEGGRTYMAAQPGAQRSDQAAKAVLIGRIREHLSRLEE